MKNLLFLTTFPVNSAFHGGQIRCRNLIKAYEEAGFNVITLAYYNPFHYKKGETSENDVKVAEKISMDNSLYFTDDYDSGQYSIKDNNLIQKVNELENEYHFSHIHFEHPWLFPLVKYMKEKNPEVFFIFGTANIEYRLKESIYAQYGLIQKVYNDKLEDIKKLEIEAARECNLILCVTEHDKKWFTDNSKKKLNSILVPNAVEAFDSNEKDPGVLELQKELNTKDWCIYVASGHPPNLLGYVECVGDFICFLPPSSKLVFVGSVCDLIKEYLDKSSYKQVDDGKYVFMGKVEKEKLNYLIAGAHTIILPITKGEGSNLKTAEALYSKKKIVGTNVSFRGYEKFMKLPGVYIANSKKDFRDAIMQSYLDPKLKLTEKHINLVKETTWEYSTKGLITYFNKSKNE